jgi:hypothetical protein
VLLPLGGVASAGTAVVLLVGEAVATRLTPDEWQHLSVAADIARGVTQYVDAWDNHTHGLHTILAWVLNPHCVEWGVVIGARCVMALCAGALGLSLTLLLAVAGCDATVARGAGFLALFSPALLFLGYEIRPDLLLTWAWLLALLPLLACFGGAAEREPIRPSSGRHLACGALLGLGFAFSVKALICFCGYLAGLAFATSRGRWRASRVVADASYAGLAFLAVGCTWVLLGVPVPSRAAFVEQVLVGNLASVERFPPSFTTYQIGLWLLAVVGIADGARNWRRLSERDLFLLGACVVPTLVYLFVMPAPYPQMMLTLIPLLALHASRGLQLVRGHARAGPIIGLVLLLLYALPTVSKCTRRLLQLSEQREEFARIAMVESLVPATGTVFDGYGKFYSRPHPYDVGAFVKAVKYQFADGTRRVSDVVDALDRARTPVVVRDRRVEALGGALSDYLEAHYAPLPAAPEILVHR